MFFIKKVIITLNNESYEDFCMTIEQIQELLKILQCPVTGGELVYVEEKNMFYSAQAKLYYPIKDDIVILLAEEAIAE